MLFCYRTKPPLMSGILFVHIASKLKKDSFKFANPHSCVKLGRCKDSNTSIKIQKYLILKSLLQREK